MLLDIFNILYKYIKIRKTMNLYNYIIYNLYYTNKWQILNLCIYNCTLINNFKIFFQKIKN